MNSRIQYRLKLIKPLLVPLVLLVGCELITFSFLSARPESNWRYLLALLPALPGIWLALGIVRLSQRLDELERKNLQDGITFSFAGTLLLTLSLGFLNLAGLPAINPTWIGLFMLILWLVGKLWSGRTYR